MLEFVKILVDLVEATVLTAVLVDEVSRERRTNLLRTIGFPKRRKILVVDVAIDEFVAPHENDAREDVACRIHVGHKVHAAALVVGLFHAKVLDGA